MTDVFKIRSGSNIKQGCGVYSTGAGIPTNTTQSCDTNDTAYEVGAQNAGGGATISYGGVCLVYADGSSLTKDNSGCWIIPSGTSFTGVSVGSCLSGVGTVASPISITLDPSGGLECGVDGIKVVATLSGLTSVSTGSCLSGLGTTPSPLQITLDPTGGIECGANGLRVTADASGVVPVVVTTCLTGNGTSTNPIAVQLDPTGGLSCGSVGLVVSNYDNLLTSVTVGSCLTGDGTSGNAIELSLDPTGGIDCGALGLKLNATASGVIPVTAGNCLTGNGTVSSPLNIQLDPTGNLSCGAGGLVCTVTGGSSTVSTSGCISGDGSVGSPIIVTLDPTGGLDCGGNGLYVQNYDNLLASVSVGDCLTGDGTSGSPIQITLDPTGGINCGANGLYISDSLTGSGISSVEVGSCFSGNGTVGNALELVLDPTGGIICGAGGLAIDTSLTGSGISSVVVGDCLSGDGTVGNAIQITLDPTGGLTCGAGGLVVQNYDNLLSSVSVTGCVAGDGTALAPLTVPIDASGGLECGGNGLTIGAAASGLVPISIGSCLTGNGTLSSPLEISLDPDGGIECLGGLRISADASGIVPVAVGDCLGGNGTLSSPLTITLDPTGGLACGDAGLVVENYDNFITAISVTGCLTGDGTAVAPLEISVDVGGGLECGGSGLAISAAASGLVPVSVSGCLTGNGTIGSPLSVRLDPTGGITCGVNGLVSSAASFDPADYISNSITIIGSGGASTEYSSLSSAFAAVVDGDQVLIPAGSYPVSTQLELYNATNVTIICPYGRARIYRATNTTNINYLFLVDDSVTDSTFQNLDFDSVASGTNTGYGRCFAIAGDRNRIINCSFKDAYNTQGASDDTDQIGCTITGDNVDLINCYAENCRYAGYRTNGDFIRVIGCRSHNCLLSLLHNSQTELLSIVDFIGTADTTIDGAININPGLNQHSKRLILRDVYLNLPNYTEDDDHNCLKIQNFEEMDLERVYINSPSVPEEGSRSISLFSKVRRLNMVDCVLSGRMSTATPYYDGTYTTNIGTYADYFTVVDYTTRSMPVDGDTIVFYSGTLAGGTVTYKRYFVVEADSVNHRFKVSETLNGTPVTLTSDAVGTTWYHWCIDRIYMRNVEFCRDYKNDYCLYCQVAPHDLILENCKFQNFRLMAIRTTNVPDTGRWRIKNLTADNTHSTTVRVINGGNLNRTGILSTDNISLVSTSGSAIDYSSTAGEAYLWRTLPDDPMTLRGTLSQLPSGSSITYKRGERYIVTDASGNNDVATYQQVDVGTTPNWQPISIIGASGSVSFTDHEIGLGDVVICNGGTSDVDFSDSSNIPLFVADDTTLTFSAPSSARPLRVLVMQDPTGGHVLTWPSLNGSTPIVETSGNVRTLVNLYFDGTYYHV